MREREHLQHCHGLPCRIGAAGETGIIATAGIMAGPWGTAADP
jgi:hypothetical protein